METTMFIRIEDTRRVALLAAVALVTVAATAAAQTNSVQSRWDAWLGCWKAAELTTASVSAPAAARPLVCVTRTSLSSAVEIATLQNGAVVARDTIDASGQQRAVSAQGCTGWERAQWSGDARRVYVRSELTCGSGLKRTGTGILAISPAGEWLDVQGVSVGSGSGVRVTHYIDAPPSPADVLPAVPGASVGRQLATSTARTAAGGALDVAAIVEAVKQVDTAVVQAWIVERGARFKLDVKHLVALADAGVPGSVTDVMIGVSYPEHFALNQRPAGVWVADADLTPLDSARLVSRYLTERCFGVTDPTWYTPGIYDPCGSRFGYRGYGYGQYGFSSYGYGRGYPLYGYSNFGYSGYYGAPIVVVKGSETPHGKLIKGVGYTSGSSSGTSTSGGSSSTSSRTAGAGPTGSSGSGSGSSGSSSSSSAGGGRTAHPRPPT
jgi:hypothetical protein